MISEYAKMGKISLYIIIFGMVAGLLQQVANGLIEYGANQQVIAQAVAKGEREIEDGKKLKALREANKATPEAPTLKETLEVINDVNKAIDTAKLDSDYIDPDVSVMRNTTKRKVFKRGNSSSGSGVTAVADIQGVVHE